MAVQNYSSMDFRIGKLKGAILAKAIPTEVLGITGQNEKMPKNNSDTVVFRRYIPTGGTDNKLITQANFATFASDRQLQEGVTPNAKTLTKIDVQATLQQYGTLFSFTDKTIDLGEDNITDEMKSQVGEEIGAVREMIRYGALRGATNVYYAGGSSRATVAKALTLNLLRRVTRNLKANHAKMPQKMLAPALEYGTKAVEASYLVFASTDMESVIRNLAGFKNVVDYGQRKPISPFEIGSVESFRFILSPELQPYINAGAAIGATGLNSTGGSLIDVYPMIVVGEDAWGQVALRGSESLDVTFIPAGQKDKTDPLGQRGYIGASTWMTALVLNQGWMALIECGTDALPD